MQKKDSSALGDLFGFEDLMSTEEPELAEQCSQSSFKSQNGKGKASGNIYFNIVSCVTLN